MTRRSTAVLTKKEKLPIVVIFCVFPVFLEHSPAKFDGISPDFAGISVFLVWWALASPVMYPNLARRRTGTFRNTEDDWLVRNAAANVTALLHGIVHTRVLPCPAMGVLRTPGEEMRGEGDIITEKKMKNKFSNILIF